MGLSHGGPRVFAEARDFTAGGNDIFAFIPDGRGQGGVQGIGPPVILFCIYGTVKFLPLPAKGRQGQVQAKKLRAAVKIRAHMLPVKSGLGLTPGPEQGLGGNAIYSRAVGYARINRVIGIECPRFPFQGVGGIGKHKGIIPGSP